jgi:hypothetical protein
VRERERREKENNKTIYVKQRREKEGRENKRREKWKIKKIPTKTEGEERAQKK